MLDEWREKVQIRHGSPHQGEYNLKGGKDWYHKGSLFFFFPRETSLIDNMLYDVGVPPTMTRECPPGPTGRAQDSLWPSWGLRNERAECTVFLENRTGMGPWARPGSWAHVCVLVHNHQAHSPSSASTVIGSTRNTLTSYGNTKGEQLTLLKI